MSENKNAVQCEESMVRLIGQVEKIHGKGAIQCMGGQDALEAIAVIETGSLAIDKSLGIGGYPQGRIVEIFGPESSGKTTLALHAIAKVQQQGRLAALIDAEHAFDIRYAQAIGVNLPTLMVSQPDHGEQALDIVELLAKSGDLGLVVVDSVAALVPKAEIDGDMGDSHLGLHARLMSQALRKLTGLANRSQTTILFINQLRQKIGVSFGNPETTTGGMALKFYSSVRLDVRRTGKVTQGDSVVGNRTRVKVVKNKCAPPFAEAEFDIRWGLGIDAAIDLIETGVALGVLEKSGSYIHFQGTNIGQGRERCREALLSDNRLFEQLRSATRAQLVQSSFAVGTTPVAEEEDALERVA
jgi:recombination protein RecA